MFFIFLALVVAPASDFTISDTTDNVTGKRSVFALQVKNDDNLSILYLRCDDRRPTVAFKFLNYSAPEWAVITLSGGDGPPTPMIFERVGDTTNELRLYGEAAPLMRLIREDEIREFVVHSAGGERSASFGMTGLTDAWKRVTTNCH